MNEAGGWKLIFVRCSFPLEWPYSRKQILNALWLHATTRQLRTYASWDNRLDSCNSGARFSPPDCLGKCIAPACNGYNGAQQSYTPIGQSGHRCIVASDCHPNRGSIRPCIEIPHRQGHVARCTQSSNLLANHFEPSGPNRIT